MGKDYGTGVVVVSNTTYNINNGDKITAPTVCAYGTLHVYEGGMATQIVESGGLVIIEPGATFSFTPTTFSNLTLTSTNKCDRATVHSGTTAINNTIGSRFSFEVYSGGTANGTIIDCGIVFDDRGSMTIYTGGVANNTMQTSGAIFVEYGGIANSTTVKDDMYVQSGATVNYTVIQGPGDLYLLHGTANSTTVSAGGKLFAEDGGVADTVIVKDQGHLYAEKGGVASNATVSAGGEFLVSYGGLAKIARVSGGSMAVKYGGVASSATIYGGNFDVNGSSYRTTLSAGIMNVRSTTGVGVESGGTADSTTVSQGGYFYVGPDTFASNTKIFAYGSMYVSNGGRADKTTLSANAAYLNVVEGASVENTTVSAGSMYVAGEADVTTVTGTGEMFVHDGGQATDVKVSAGGRLNIMTDGLTDGATVINGALHVSNGGSAANASVRRGGLMHVSNGGKAYDAVISSGGSLTVSAGGVANRTKVKSDGEMTIAQNGSANITTVSEGGAARLLGTATSTTVIYGTFAVSDGGLATSTTVDNEGEMIVSKGGQATRTTVRAYGDMIVSNGGFAELTTVSRTGLLIVSNGGSAELTTLDEGTMYVSNGGTATSIEVEQGGSLYVEAGADVTTVWEVGGFVKVSTGANVEFAGAAFFGRTISGASATVHSKTVANDTILIDNGEMYVYSGGYAGGTVMNGKGRLFVSAGGTADGATVNVGGSMYVFAGAKATGKITIAEGTTLQAYEGAVIDFDISDLSPASEKLVNDLSRITGAPTFTLTIDGSESAGMYNLAGGAADFDGTITIVNTLGVELGTLTVGGLAYTSGDSHYKLRRNGSDLSVAVVIGDIDNSPPIVTNIQASTTGPTNQDVVVTADFYDDVAVASRLYSFGGGKWDPYPEGGVVVTQSGPVYFKAVDTTGNESEVADIVIGNIDKTPPTITNITPSSTDSTPFVFVTADFADDVELESRLYKLGDSEWFPYSDFGAVVTQNCLLTFRAADTAGNEALASCPVMNIDKPGSIDITGDLDSAFYLENGMYASSVNVNDEGRLLVSNGAYAEETIVNAGGDLTVYSGGLACIITVNPGGSFYVISGGEAYMIRENGGYVDVRDGATAMFVPNEFAGLALGQGGSATVHSGTTATDTAVTSGGYFRVYSGGTATGIVAAEGAWLYLNVAPGTYEQGTYAGSAFQIMGEASGFTVHSGCRLDVSSGVASDTTVGSEGWMNVLRDGSARGVTVESGGYFNASAGGFVSGIVAADGATLYLTLANNTYAEGTYGGSWFEFESAVSGLTLRPHFHLEIGSGGTASDTSVGSACGLTVTSGGTAVETEVELGGYLTISSGGTALKVTEEGGYVNISGNADVTFVSNSFSGVVFSSVATLHSGTTATHTTVAGGPLFVYSGGVIGDTTVEAALHLSGGVATDTTVNKGGYIYVFSGGSLGHTILNSGGSLALHNAGDTAEDTVVKDGGIFVANNGTVNGVVVSSGASFFLNDRLTGKAVFETGAIVTVGGAKIEFDLTQTAPGMDALVNDLSFVMAPQTTYSITVDGYESAGTYSLAGGATGFDATITVRNTAGKYLGTLTVDGGTQTLDGRDYTLTLNGADLAVTLGAGAVAVDLTGDLDTFYKLEAGKFGSSVNIISGGDLYVVAGAYALETTVNSSGYLDVISGGSAKVVTVNSGGRLNVYEGGTATLVKENGGCVRDYDGAKVTFVPNSFGGLVLTDRVTVHSGTTATDITVGSGAMFEIYSGGTAAGVTAEHDGYFYIYSGGTATLVKENGGYVSVVDGADVTFLPNTFTGVVFSSVATIHSGTTATNATVAGGPVFVFSGGLISDTTVESSLHLEGGSATDTTVNDHGYFNIYGGVADNTTVNSGGQFGLYNSYDIAYNTTVNAGGVFYVTSYNTANGVVVSSGGSFYLYGKVTGNATF